MQSLSPAYSPSPPTQPELPVVIRTVPSFHFPTHTCLVACRSLVSVQRTVFIKKCPWHAEGEKGLISAFGRLRRQQAKPGRMSGGRRCREGLAPAFHDFSHEEEATTAAPTSTAVALGNTAVESCNATADSSNAAFSRRLSVRATTSGKTLQLYATQQ